MKTASAVLLLFLASSTSAVKLYGNGYISCEDTGSCPKEERPSNGFASVGNVDIDALYSSTEHENF